MEIPARGGMDSGKTVKTSLLFISIACKQSNELPRIHPVMDYGLSPGNTDQSTLAVEEMTK